MKAKVKPSGTFTWSSLDDVYVPPMDLSAGIIQIIFDGENDYVEIDEGIFNLYYGEGDDCNYTISSKIKINDLEKEGIILGNGDNSTGLYIKVTSEGKINLHIGEENQTILIFNQRKHGII